MHPSVDQGPVVDARLTDRGGIDRAAVHRNLEGGSDIRLHDGMDDAFDLDPLAILGAGAQAGESHGFSIGRQARVAEDGDVGLVDDTRIVAG